MIILLHCTVIMGVERISVNAWCAVDYCLSCTGFIISRTWLGMLNYQALYNASLHL